MTVIGASAFWSSKASDETFVNELHDVITSCNEFAHPYTQIKEKSSTVPDEVAVLLSLIDHVFVLSFHECDIELPPFLLGRSKCIKGEILDRCVPKKFIMGSYRHAMKVTLSHAVILHMSRIAGHNNVAILENDIDFAKRRLSPLVVGDFRKLLQSSSWNFIRFGFRPYFLQESGAVPCPDMCRCELSSSYGDHLCELKQAGCDIRSSDFFVVHSRQFAHLEARLLDLRKKNSKRIIDVYPMRAVAKQWLFLPQISFQKTLDIPVDYQIGAGALYVKKCAGPRPLPERTAQNLQLSTTFVDMG